MYRYISVVSAYPAHGNCLKQRQFLDWAKERYYQKLYIGYEIRKRPVWKGSSLMTEYRHYTPNTYWQGREESVIQWIYKWGRDYQICFLDYQQFKRWLLDRDNKNTKAREWRRRRYSWWDNSGEDSFRQIGYLKKQRSHIHKQREEWRKKMGHYKDKAKQGWSQSRRSCPKWLKRYCNKKHRQRERQHIDCEKYDGLHNITPKNIYDRWMWD